MKAGIRLMLCCLLALVLGLAGGFALRQVVPDRSLAAASDWISSSSPEGDPLSLVSCALETVAAMEDQDYAALSQFVHPQSGVTFTPTATVDPASNLTFSPGELAQAGTSNTTYLWGTSPSTSSPIKLTVADYFHAYVWDRDYTSALHISVDTPQISGNALENTLESYPDCHYVEFYYPATDNQSDWSTLRLVYQWYHHDWYLVGIVHSAWSM